MRGNEWLNEERQYLILNYPKVKRGAEMRELLARLSRHSRGSIREEAYRLGVSCYSDQYRERTDEVYALLIKKGKLSTVAISQECDIPVKSLYDLMKTLIKAGQVRKIMGEKENGHAVAFWEAIVDEKPVPEPYVEMEKLKKNAGNPFALML